MPVVDSCELDWRWLDIRHARAGIVNERMRRMEKLLPNGKGVWIAMDHSVSQPQKGLVDIGGLIHNLSTIDAIVAHKGIIRHFQDVDTPFVMHMSASTIHGGHHADDKVLIGSVTEAISYGAQAVSVQVNLGSVHETQMLERLGKISTQCTELDMPLLGMIYPKGPNLSIQPDDITSGIMHCARLGWELGCDVVKVPWTGDAESFTIVRSSVPIPILVAGGLDDGDLGGFYQMMEQAMLAGASGVCVGRQVFNAENPKEVASHITTIVRENSR